MTKFKMKFSSNLALSMLLLLINSAKNAHSVLRGNCRQCLANNVACVDESRFATCLNGEMTTNLTPCPAGTVCTAEPQICKTQADGFNPICFDDNCGSCERTGRVFACLDEVTYGFCLGEVEPYEDAIEKCPTGYVCSVLSDKVCVSENEGGEASCITGNEEPTTTELPTPTPTPTPSPSPSPSPTPTATPTLPPLIDPDIFCENEKATGSFKPTDDDTCRDYIYCYLLSGQYLGIRYICPQYYNAESRECQAEKPIDC